jgi:hypothetical protein
MNASGSPRHANEIGVESVYSAKINQFQIDLNNSLPRQRGQTPPLLPYSCRIDIG